MTSTALRRPPASHDSLSPTQQRAVVGAIVLLHVGLGWALMQVQAVREAVAETAPMLFDMVAPPAPPPPLPVPPPPPPPQRVLPKAPPPPLPLVTAAPSPAPATFTAPPPPIEPPEPTPIVAAPPAPVAVQAPPAPPAPPVPKMIPASAVQWLSQVMPVYSPAMARAKEKGLVMLSVFIDEAGLPSRVSVQQSSNLLRVDDACATAVKKSRFKPPTDNGKPITGWALVPCDIDF